MEQLKLFEFALPIPGACMYETRMVDMSGKGTNIKSFCEQMKCWTNCREMGHCTSDGRKHNRMEVEA